MCEYENIVEDMENELNGLLESDDPLSVQEVFSVSRLSFKLGMISVYNENGWDLGDILD